MRTNTLTPARRIALALLSTASAVALLFGYHTSTAGPLATASTPSVALVTDTSDTSAASGTAGTAGTSGTSGTSGTAGTSGTVTGGVAQTRWGPVQVQVTLADGTITGVDVVQYPNGNGKDVQINSYALPILIQETLEAQSAGVDMVSGATVTSVGYTQSLQSALDEAGL